MFRTIRAPAIGSRSIVTAFFAIEYAVHLLTEQFEPFDDESKYSEPAAQYG